MTLVYQICLINENILNILRDYAKRHNLTDTQALESAILLQSNIEKLKGDMVMKICIPTSEGKLCGHFGHCDSFTFAEINPETKEILTIEEKYRKMVFLVRVLPGFQNRE